MTRRPQIRSDLSELTGYHSPQLDVDVRLNTNESPEPPPDEFRSAVAEATASTPWHRYPDRQAAQLRAALARHHGVAVDQVFAANGSNEVIQTLLLTFGGPGRVAATFEPTYALHRHLASITGTGHLAGRRDAGFAVGADELDRALDQQPAVVFFCSPNNPTGNAEDRQTVLDAVARAGAWGGLVVVDEAYGQFCSWTALDLIDTDRNLAVCRTFSKTWAMAGARLGYLVGPSWLVAELEKVVLPYHLDRVTQTAGLLALDHADAMAARVARLVEARGELQDRLSQLDLDVWPSEANFILFRPRRRDATEVWQGMVDRSVLVRDCSSWPRLEGCLRVTIGSAEENGRFLTALEAVLESPETSSQEST
jgi:histidinol-phosphate aminotransferase